MRLRLLLTLLFLSPACAGPRKGYQHGEGMPHRFDDAESWAARFEDPSRDEWQRPDEVLAALALAPDARVADIGAATGYFAVRLAKAVPGGAVYGVDIESSMVEYLARRATREGLSNLTAVLGAPDDARLPEAVDVVLVVNTYHHVSQRPAYFRRLLASLRPKGRLAIIDFTRASPKGPPAADKVPPEAIEDELKSAGYVLQARHDFLPDQFFLIFGKAGSAPST